MTPPALHPQPGRGGRRPPRRRTPWPARPATVWRCADPAGQPDDTDAGAGTGWLASAVARIVTTYSRPGQAVLLLAPPPAGRAGPAGPRRWTAATLRASQDPFAGLHAAAEAVGRLGRRVHTRTAQTVGTEIHTAGRPASGSDSRPRPVGPDSAESAAGPSVGPAPASPDGEPDRFDAVVTAADPAEAGWVHTVAWEELLAPSGTLAVITYSDNRAGWLTDPTTELVRAAHGAGLGLLDQVVLLEVPIRASRLAATPGGPRPHTAGHLPASLADGAPHRAHSHLLLFAVPLPRHGAQPDPRNAVLDAVAGSGREAAA